MMVGDGWRAVGRRFRWPLLAMFAALSTAAAAEMESVYPPPGTYELQRIMRFPDGALVDSAGDTVRLSGVTRRAITLLAFFYSTCRDPNGCPVAWSTFEQVFADAGKDPQLAGRLRLVFVSLDPEADQPTIMNVLERSYREQAGSIPWRFYTSRSATDIAPLLDRVGQDVAVDTDASGDRVVNHMLKVFLIDTEGWVREIYTTAFLSLDAVANDIRTLVMEQPQATNAPVSPSFLQRVRAWLGFTPR
jgi:cytochrome oxidase Cu insertion factor (SCO1/SenC/PrrC family)